MYMIAVASKNGPLSLQNP